VTYLTMLSVTGLLSSWWWRQQTHLKRW
jgi:hypothetical protein